MNTITNEEDTSKGKSQFDLNQCTYYGCSHIKVLDRLKPYSGESEENKDEINLGSDTSTEKVEQFEAVESEKMIAFLSDKRVKGGKLFKKESRKISKEASQHEKRRKKAKKYEIAIIYKKPSGSLGCRQLRVGK